MTDVPEQTLTETPTASAVSPKLRRMARAAPGQDTSGHIRLDSYNGKPEVFVESNRAARLLALAFTLVIVFGTGRWWSEAIDRFEVPDSVRPAGFRVPQRALAFAGIASAVVETVYLLYFTLFGRVWRRWRGVTIVFAVLTFTSTMLWLFDRFLLDQIIAG
jgi:hypothetical protein